MGAVVAPEVAQDVLERVAALSPEHAGAGPQLREPGSERFHGGIASGWEVWWEEGPDDWPFTLARRVGVEQVGAFVEPINPWSVGIYPA